MDLNPEDILKSAELARQATATQAPQALSTVLTFFWGRERYALPLEAAKEVVAVRGVTPIPGLPGHLLGATNYRGEVIAVFDARPLAGMPPGLVHPHSYMIVLDVDGEPAGMLVDGLGDIQEIPAVSGSDWQPDDTDLLISVDLPDGGLLPVLDVTELVARLRPMEAK